MILCLTLWSWVRGSLGDPQERKEQAEQGIEINNHTLTTASYGDAGKADDPMCMRGQGEGGTGRGDLQLAGTWPPSRERLDTPRAAGGNRVSAGQGQGRARTRLGQLWRPVGSQIRRKTFH